MPQNLPDIAALLPSWELALRAERKAPGTVAVYGDGVRAFLRSCAAERRTPELNRAAVQAFALADLLDGGAEAGHRAHPAQRPAPVQRLAGGGGGAAHPDPAGAPLTHPVDTKVVHALSEDQLKRAHQGVRGPGAAGPPGRGDRAADDRDGGTRR